jgi:hypothetical protein
MGGAPATAELAAVRVLACGSPESSRAGALTALNACDPQALAHELRERRLLALLGSRAVAIWGDAVPAGFEADVDADVAANRARGLALEALSARFVAHLDQAGIQALVLKGPLQARRLHGDVGYRMSNDVDLLVAGKDLGPATNALAPLGYSVEPATPIRGHGFPDIHAILNSTHVGLPRIDLHWRVHWYEEKFSEDLGARSRKRGSFLEPEPVDDLAALMLFYARDGFYGLRAAVDIAAWCAINRAVEQPWLARHCREYPRLRRALAAAAIATERTVGVPATALVPPSCLRQRTPRLAANLANWAQTGEPDQLRANITVVDALLSPPAELSNFARRELFVTRSELHSMYGLPSTARLRTAAMRIVHVPKVLARQLAGLRAAFGARRASGGRA